MREIDLIPDEPYTMSKDLLALRDSVNTDIQKAIDFATKLAGRVDALRNLPAESYTSAHLAEARKVADDQVKNVNSELAIRRRLRDEWYPAVQKARRAAADASWIALENVREEVRKAMISIGFPEGLHPDSGIALITPGQISVHPKVKAARIKNDELVGLASSNESVAENNGAIAMLEHTLKLSVQSLLRQPSAA